MKRYFIADIIGDGSDTDEYRAAVAVYPVNWSAEVPWNDAENRPTNVWTVAEVSGGDMSGFTGDPRIDPLPICELSTPVGQIDDAQMASMRASLQRRGIGVSLDAAETFGAIIALLRIRAGEATVVPTKATLEL